MSKDPNTQPAAKAVADEYITITVAEYVFLVKAATMLEVVANDQTYNRDAVAAVKSTVQAMLQPAEVGAAE